MPVEVSLDGALEPLWGSTGATEGGTLPSALRVVLRASDALHEAFSPFAPDVLVARGCRLTRHVDPGGELVEGGCRPSPTSVRHALRFATQPALLRRGWILVHACAIALPGGVHVFAAPSGTGKTTFARRAASAGHRVLADEIVLVNGSRAAAHPAQASCEPTDPLPLAALHFLERGEPSSRPVSPAVALARLLSLTMVYERLPETESLAMVAAGRIVEATDTRITVVPDDDRAAGVLEEVGR